MIQHINLQKIYYILKHYNILKQLHGFNHVIVHDYVPRFRLVLLKVCIPEHSSA